jgi:hypothetical protein
MSTRIYHLPMATDKEAAEFVNQHRATIEQVNGELWCSCGFGTVAPVVVLILPANVQPETVKPGFAWTEYTGA